MSGIHFAPASKTTSVGIPSNLKRKLRSESNPIAHFKSIDEWSPFEDFKATVVPALCEARRFDQIPYEYDAVPTWGLRPTSDRSKSGIHPGDHVIFYTGSGDFPFIGRIDKMGRSIELAETLWPCFPLKEKLGSNAPTGPDSKIIYFDVVWYASIPKKWIQNFRYTNNEDTVIRGFSSVPSHRLKRIRTKTGRSLSDILSDFKQNVASLAIKWEAERADWIRQAISEGTAEEEILTQVLEPYTLTPEDLSDSAEERVIDCLKRVYG